MVKRVLFLLLACLSALVSRAQWTAKDSLSLQRILGGKEEIKLNMDAVKQIDLSTPLGAPRTVKNKPGLRIDETLPTVNNKKKIVLTLHPYSVRTKYNWDPVYQRKIKVDAYSWRSNSFDRMIAMGLSRPDVIKLGKKGTTLSGGTIGGLDFMTLFTKDFWDKKGRATRERTLEVLKAYGDSTTVLVPHSVLEPITR